MLTYDASLAWAALLLLAIGLVMVYSASIAMAEASAYTGFRAWYFLAAARDLRRASASSPAFVAFQVPMKAWQRLAPWLFVGGVAAARAGARPRHRQFGQRQSRRWLSLVVVNLQPSEFMKLAVVLYAASYAVRKAAFLHAEQPLKQTLVQGFLPLFVVMVATAACCCSSPTSARSS